MNTLPVLWLAVDCEDANQALTRIMPFQGLNCGIKIGMELFSAAGPSIVNRILEAGFRVFLDLKWHDIPQTVARTVTVAQKLGVHMVTVHASGGDDMLKAAVDAAGAVRVLAVTLLTALDAPLLRKWSIGLPPEQAIPSPVAPLQPHVATPPLDPLAECAALWAHYAAEQGVHGVVCSGHEVARIKAKTAWRSPPITCLVPGIRWPEDPAGDQKRVVSPQHAIRCGADYIVMGRPIWNAPEPLEAAKRALMDMGLPVFNSGTGPAK